MRVALFVSIVLFSSTVFAQVGTKAQMLCKTWVQVGFKPFGKSYMKVDSSAGKVVTFEANGRYDEVDYGMLKFGGSWKFNADSSKLAVAMDEMNGQKVANVLPLADTPPTDTLLILTPDSLVYGAEAYYGPNKIYGHDDSYFVPARK